MHRLKSQIWVIVIIVLAAAAWFGNEDSRAVVQTQETDYVLEIERYPDEPLQLVNLKIGTHSVKDRIRRKFKDNQSNWGTDVVKFAEKDDWVKRVSITLRNTSDKPVYGLQSYLFFKPIGFPMMFSLSLTAEKELRHEPLQLGAEIVLSVNPGLLNQTMEDVKNRGANLSGAVVSFSLDTVIFTDQLRWYRGKLLRPDPAVPGKWISVSEPMAVKRSSPSQNAASLNHAVSKSTAPVVFSTCTQWNGSYSGNTCASDIVVDCIQRTDIDDNINPGLLSHVPCSGLCINDSLSGQTCTKTTVHSRLQTDSNCQVCPDADNDTFQSAACGGTDCNDSDASINPGATEDCEDGIDNDCDGCSCDMWSEGPIWQQSLDCTPCNDGVNNDCDIEGADHLDSGCGICQGTPVLIDVLGNGFSLTNAAAGVNFDLDSDGNPEKLAWTVPQSDDAWLALDRNGDGTIKNGTELFGNFTPQSDPPFGNGRNGFNALVEYDLVAKGGNADGLITERDAVFAGLLLWQDKNHNGVSEMNELRTLKELGLAIIECDYKESKRQDQYGNQFRYRAKVKDTRNTQVGRWAWDVILVRERDPKINWLMDRVNRTTSGPILGWLQM